MPYPRCCPSVGDYGNWEQEEWQNNPPDFPGGSWDYYNGGGGGGGNEGQPPLPQGAAVTLPAPPDYDTAPTTAATTTTTTTTTDNGRAMDLLSAEFTDAFDESGTNLGQTHLDEDL